MTWASGKKIGGGKYIVERQLGEGGFGITYLAHNLHGQQVVIKTLNDTVQNRANLDKFQQDFLDEASSLAKCEHPNIVRIIQLIYEKNIHCIVMEYINGESLADRIRNSGILSESEALDYIRQIGAALTFVHSKGLLHRDVKPENIMIRANTSKAILIDFGIAREFTSNLTQTHTSFVTNCYAPIEQYDVRAKRGAFTDVYALAATLYVILTGELPISAPARAANTPLIAPRQINPFISDQVNQAILKGMAFRPQERPQSIQKLLEMMGLTKGIISSPVSSRSNFSVQKPIPGKTISSPAPSQFFGKQSSTPTRLLVHKTQPNLLLKLKLSLSKRFKLKPSLNKRFLFINAILLLMLLQIYGSFRYGDFPINDPISSITRLPSSFFLARTLVGHSKYIHDITISSDNKTLISGSYDGTIKTWNLNTGHLLQTLPSGDVSVVAVSPDGQTLVSGHLGSITVWNLSKGEVIYTLDIPSWTGGLAISPDGKFFVGGTSQAYGRNIIKSWDLQTGKLLHTFTENSDCVYAVAISPDGQTLISGHDSGEIKIWNLITGDLVRTISGNLERVASVSVSPDGQVFASSGGYNNDFSIKIWNLKTGELLHILPKHSKGVWALAFSPDGQTLASSSLDKTIRLWNPKTGNLNHTFFGHSDWVTSLAFTPDSKLLASGGQDKIIGIWRVPKN